MTTEETKLSGQKFIYEMDRGTQAIPCECGGYCDITECTDNECKEFGCGRDRPEWTCCAVAFLCRVCGKRYAGKQSAPEMAW